MGPDHHVSRFRKHGEEGSKPLPIFQLCRGQRALEGQVPIISRELRDGDIRVRAIRKKRREAHKER